MVEANDEDRANNARAGAGLMLAQRLQGLSLDERSERLAQFVPQKTLYDEALSATQVQLVKDEETDLVSAHYHCKYLSGY